ncbi:MAG: CoA-transferase subunit beta, partial [Chloroflexota bacterium]|nr:CoA-transferase subunit beta [Chloroflexota bacterium]
PDGNGGRPPWAGAGPTAVVTQLGVYYFTPDGEMELAGLHPGVDEETVDAGTAWAMRRAATVTRLSEPSGQTLEAIRRLVG